MERLMSLRSIEELFRIGDIRELDLLPPYKRVWMSSGDKGLNPLSEDPERVTDEQLMVSFGNIFRTVEPGGIVRISYAVFCLKKKKKHGDEEHTSRGQRKETHVD